MPRHSALSQHLLKRFPASDRVDPQSPHSMMGKRLIMVVMFVGEGLMFRDGISIV